MTARLLPAVGGLLLVLGGALFGAGTPQEPPAGPKGGADHKWIGAAVCQDCHDNDDPARKPLYQETRGFEFVRLWENRVWAAHDPHATAYKNLLTDRTAGKGGPPNPVAQRMEDLLRRTPERGDKYTVAADVQCLACHASTRRPVEQVPPAKWASAREAFATTDGVGCEMCHGHGSEYQYIHQQSREVDDPSPGGPTRVVDWREWPPDQKRAKGLIDLRDPATAADRCASCHVGNLADGRFVTHEMFAAGHPPLPPLDLPAFTREQPRHWGLPAELPYLAALAKSDPAKARAVFHVRAGESRAARHLAEGAVAVLRSTLVLTGQLADAAGKADDGLDYAAFDCTACHHDLKYPSDRQARGYTGPPGRPLFRPAPFALARVVVGHAAGMPGGADLKGQAEALLAAEKGLAEAFGAKTFGDPAKVESAARAATDWCTAALAGLAKVEYTPAEAEKLLAAVVAAARRPVADPEVAQLLVWAHDTLALDLAGEPPGAVPPAVAKLHEALKGTVVTRLRPDRPFVAEPTPASVRGAKPSPVSDRLGERMRTFNNFRGDVFRKALE